MTSQYHLKPTQYHIAKTLKEQQTIRNKMTIQEVFNSNLSHVNDKKEGGNQQLIF
jgi:hypothetical protein